MENIEIINLWKQYDEKIEKSISLNQKIMVEILQQKMRRTLRSLKINKVLAIIIGILYVVFLGYILYYSLEFSKIFFAVSLGIHLLVTVIAIGVYIWQLIQIQEIDNSNDIIQSQQKLADLKTSTLKVVGLCFLQMPVFTTWFISFKWIQDSPTSFWLIQVPIVLFFTFLGGWLFKNINIKNANKKWFQFLFSGKEWTSIIDSGKFLQEIADFKETK